MDKELDGRHFISSLTVVSLLIALCVSFAFHHSLLEQQQMPSVAFDYMIFWLVIAILFSVLSYKAFVPCYLVSLFCMMIAWRITGIYAISIMSMILLFAFILMTLNFFYCATMNLKKPGDFRHSISLGEWQLIFIRLYIGLDLIPHFTEKLFAGPVPHLADINAFISLGMPNADLFVWLAGLCEFGGAIALSLGFMMRLGTFCAVLYLAIATYLGNHFLLGFIWANPGGGWEFATMWMLLILSFTVTGFRAFTIDQYLEDRFNIPRLLKKLM